MSVQFQWERQTKETIQFYVKLYACGQVLSAVEKDKREQNQRNQKCWAVGAKAGGLIK